MVPSLKGYCSHKGDTSKTATGKENSHARMNRNSCSLVPTFKRFLSLGNRVRWAASDWQGSECSKTAVPKVLLGRWEHCKYLRGWGGCPNGATAIMAPQAPLCFFTYLVDWGGGSEEFMLNPKVHFWAQNGAFPCLGETCGGGYRPPQPFWCPPNPPNMLKSTGVPATSRSLRHHWGEWPTFASQWWVETHRLRSTVTKH